MKRFRRASALCGLSAVLFFIAAAASDRSCAGDTISHTVKKGETVSLIAIDYFGGYTPEFQAQFLRDNPSIRDINLIYPGQTVRLRKPQAAFPGQDSVTNTSTVAAAQGVVTYVEGKAVLISKKDNKQYPLQSNTVVYPGDIIQTFANGKVEIIINRETAVRMREFSKLAIEAIRDNRLDKGKTHVGFSVGTLWTKMKKFKDDAARFELELPTAIAGVHGTVYESAVGKDSSSEVKVFEGEVAVAGNAKRSESGAGLSEVSGPGEVAGPQEVSMEQWVQIVRDMQRIVIDKNGKPRPVEAFVENPRDAWEQWNRERDRRISEMFGETLK